MATHSSVFAWRIPGTREPGGLLSMGSHRVGHDWSDLAAAAAAAAGIKYGLPRWLSGKESACQCRRREFNPWVRKIPWRRKWQPTPVFLPGKFYGQRSLAGFSLWGWKELDTTEHTGIKYEEYLKNVEIFNQEKTKQMEDVIAVLILLFSCSVVCDS